MANGPLARVAQAATTPGWSLSVLDGPAAVMATRDSGRIGEPWVVMTTGSGTRLRAYFYEPGDDLGAPGEELAELSGNPRELGRQLRTLLEDLTAGRAAGSET
jgi:hypothetical protein